jgi:hypothetical protein
LDNVQEHVAVELLVSQDGSEKTGVGQIFSGEAVDQEPVEHPADCLGVFLRATAGQRFMLTILFLNKLLHFFQGSMLNDISSFSVKNLTSKESPKDLDHDI